MREKRRNEPMLGIWFGNFYRPAFDDKVFIDQGIALLKKLGFNTIQLDSKAWKDFHERFEGQPASDYVAQQEYMMQTILNAGMSYHFLALYLNGDNLYPNIRFSPPIYGESITRADGSDGRWYKYWSEKAKTSMAEHVEGLLKCYETGVTRVQLDGKERLPICSMWDPIAAPSFDQEGRKHYFAYLQSRYENIEAFNESYQTAFDSFEIMQPTDYWYTAKNGEQAIYTLTDKLEHTPAFIMWTDNMRYLSDVLIAFFKDMKERLHQVDERLYLIPNMAQWSYFLNVDTTAIEGIGFSDLWDTAMRGIDIFKLKNHVDMCHFYAVPVTMEGDADGYTVSCQHAMIRTMNANRPFLGGIYWGRFLYNNVYDAVSPAQIVAVIAASGAGGINSYGYCGLDDGGVLDRMDEGFLHSLQTGNEWFKRVVPKVKGKRKKEIAILFPSAMALLEPLRISGAKNRRMDLLGYYKLLCDLGYMVDVIDADSVKDGALCDYKALILPADDCYHMMRNEALEKMLYDYCENGGLAIMGTNSEIGTFAFDVHFTQTHAVSYDYKDEGGLLLDAPHATVTGVAVACYRQNGGAAIAKTAIGQGNVLAMGFLAGYQYGAKTAPHVPLVERNNALYPFPLMRHNAIADLLAEVIAPSALVIDKNLESAQFENGAFLINHSSHPVTMPKGKYDFQYDVDGHTLIGHSAVWIENKVE